MSDLRLCYAAKGLIRDFKDVLGRLPEDGQLRTLQVGWANRHWLTCVSDVLGTLFDQDSMQRLGFTAIAEGEDRAAQVEDARLFTKLIIRTASARSWSMAVWSELPPENLCGIAAADVDEANKAFARARADKEQIEAALAATCSAARHPEHEARPGVRTRFCKNT